METPPGFNLDQAVVEGSRKPTDKRVWAPRVFWLFFGVFAINALYSLLYDVIEVLVHYFGAVKVTGADAIFAPQMIFTQRLLPALLAGYCLVRGVPRFVIVCLSSRARVTVLCGLLFLLSNFFDVFDLMAVRGLSVETFLPWGFGRELFISSLYSLCLIVPMIWLAPFAAAQKNISADPLSQIPAPFNLEQAIAFWRAELARQPGLIPSDSKELEAHLRDAFAELRKNKLGEPEAFLLAQQRIGAAAPVAAEFAKASPRRIWARRLFWLAFGLFGFEVWPRVAGWLFVGLLNLLPVYFNHGQFYGPGTWAWLTMYSTALLNMPIPVFIAAYWLARGVPQFVTKRLATRAKVAAVGVGLFVLANIHLMYVLLSFVNPWFVADSTDYRISIFDSEILWQLCLLALMIWLTPRREKTKVKAHTVAA